MFLLTVIEERNSKKKFTFWNRLKKLSFDKGFKNIKNELDFHDCSTGENWDPATAK